MIDSVLSLPILIAADQVIGREGMALGAGSLAGGWIGARVELAAGAGLGSAQPLHAGVFTAVQRFRTSLTDQRP